MIKSFKIFEAETPSIKIWEMENAHDNTLRFTGENLLVDFDEFELLRGLRRTTVDGITTASKKFVFETYGGDYSYLKKDREEIKEVLKFERLEREINKYNL